MGRLAAEPAPAHPREPVRRAGLEARRVAVHRATRHEGGIAAPAGRGRVLVSSDGLLRPLRPFLHPAVLGHGLHKEGDLLRHRCHVHVRRWQQLGPPCEPHPEQGHAALARGPFARRAHDRCRTRGCCARRCLGSRLLLVDELDHQQHLRRVLLPGRHQEDRDLQLQDGRGDAHRPLLLRRVLGLRQQARLRLQRHGFGGEGRRGSHQADVPEGAERLWDVAALDARTG
mmetsp:Transcript_29212/g.82959  ORF Transcript_29212/g.82959 Transcript_29212/m.82959 type:complete len:229 (-) Transcript_29212:404-1090(-)